MPCETHYDLKMTMGVRTDGNVRTEETDGIICINHESVLRYASGVSKKRLVIGNDEKLWPSLFIDCRLRTETRLLRIHPSRERS